MMAPLITLVVLLLAVGPLVYYLRRARTGPPTTAPEPASTVLPQAGEAKVNPYAGLRARALATQAAELGLNPRPGERLAYGVVMDLALASGVATIVAFNTGDVSMYTSTGGGILGGIGHESCRTAALRFIGAGQRTLEQLKPASDHAVPRQGVFRFFVLTTQGVFGGEDREATLHGGKSPLSPLFYAGNDVITALRQIEGKAGRSA